VFRLSPWRASSRHLVLPPSTLGFGLNPGCAAECDAAWPDTAGPMGDPAARMNTGAHSITSSVRADRVWLVIVVSARIPLDHSEKPADDRLPVGLAAPRQEPNQKSDPRSDQVECRAMIVGREVSLSGVLPPVRDADRAPGASPGIDHGTIAGRIRRVIGWAGCTGTKHGSFREPAGGSNSPTRPIIGRLRLSPRHRDQSDQCQGGWC
jgi:hypothetical protein